jgi:hypothetical protein
MNTQIYAVQGPDAFRLVEASSKSVALRHVARDILTVERASQKTLVAALLDGVKIEVARAASAATDTDD